MTTHAIGSHVRLADAARIPADMVGLTGTVADVVFRPLGVERYWLDLGTGTLAGPYVAFELEALTVDGRQR